MKCVSCNYYCLNRRICIIDSKFYFESFPSCENYKKNQELEDWLLRMESDSFIMIANKHTGEYRNLYTKDFDNPNTIKEIASLLEKHKNM